MLDRDFVEWLIEKKLSVITFIEGLESLLSNSELESKHASFNDEDDDDESGDEGESTIKSGRSRVTVPVRLCQ